MHLSYLLKLSAVSHQLSQLLHPGKDKFSHFEQPIPFYVLQKVNLSQNPSALVDSFIYLYFSGRRTDHTLQMKDR
jgi:hypothetical protein